MRTLATFFSGPVSSVNAATLLRFLESRRARTPNPATINSDLRALRSAFRLAVLDELIPKLPFRVKLLRVPRKAPTILAPEELKRLLAVAPRHLRALLTLAMATGLRTGELARLRWGEIVGDELVVSAESKSHAERRIPLTPDAVELLQMIRTGRADRDRVFVTRLGRPWTALALSLAVGRVFRRAGLYQKTRKPGLHMIRRTWLSAMLRNGADIETCRDLAGHHSIIVTQGYLASTDDAKRRAVGLARI